MSDFKSDVRAFIEQKIQAAADSKGTTLGELGEDFDFFESEVFDSLGLVGLLTQIEANFGVAIDFSELDPEEFTTLGGITRIVTAAQGSQTAE